MKVSELQQTLRELTQLLRSAGVKDATVGELTNFLPALDKFAGQTVKQFGELLGRLNEGGTVAPRPAGGRGHTTVDAAAVSREAVDLYLRAADRSIPDERYETVYGQLPRLTKPGLVDVAKLIKLTPAKSASKDDLVQLIQRSIQNQRGAVLRANMLDRPVAG